MFGMASEMSAQSVTYSHDAAKMNQITVAEIGSDLYNQVDDAEALDSAMTQRARIEALNVADRSGGALDMAWLAEGEKINAALENFNRNIRRITEAGGSNYEQEHWREQYNMFLCAVKSVQEAYMSNSQRKKQYLRIHADIIRKNEMLVRYLVRLANSAKVAELLDASVIIEDRRAQIVLAAMNRWREAGWRTTEN